MHEMRTNATTTKVDEERVIGVDIFPFGSNDDNKEPTGENEQHSEDKHT